MRKAVLKAFAIFTGKHVCWSAFNTCACNFIKKRLQTSVFMSILRNIAVSIIFSQYVFTLCQQYGGLGSRDMYLDTSPIKHLRWSFFPK